MKTESPMTTTRILRLNTSLFAGEGVSTQLLDELVDSLCWGYPQLEIRERDFAREPIPHLDSQYLQALGTPADQRSPRQVESVAWGEGLIREVQEADLLLIALPMYNFGIPSMLKAWFDYIARAGVTFRYTAEGAQGLLEDKKVYLVTTRGGQHRGQPGDTQVASVTTFLNFLGLNDIEVIYAEGLNMGEQARSEGLTAARAQIAAITRALSSQAATNSASMKLASINLETSNSATINQASAA